MNSRLCVLPLLGMAAIFIAAGCDQVADLGHNPGGSGGLGASSGGANSASGGANNASGGANSASGVGDPCTPIDEYFPRFSGYSVDDVNIEADASQCATRLCLVNHFQGRVSCPYGNSLSNVNISKGQTPPDCSIPGTTEPIQVAVDPQIQQRQALDSVYCSCRCAGPDENARYCSCPSGFECVELVEKLPGEGAEFAGSYCIREGTTYVKNQVVVSDTCIFEGPFTSLSCGAIAGSGEPK